MGSVLVRVTELPVVFVQKYDDEYREWAYQLWAFICGRHMEAVHDRILNPEPGDPWAAIDIPTKTLYQWSYGSKTIPSWKQRVANDLKKIAPDIHHTVLANLLFASNKFSQWVDDVANDRVPMNTGLQINAVRAKTEVAKLAFDRSGFVAYRMNVGGAEPVAPPREEDAPIAALTEGSLMDQWYTMMNHVDEREAVVVERGDDS